MLCGHCSWQARELVALLGEVPLGVGGRLVSPSRLTGQGQAGGLHGLVLHMEQVGRVMGAEAVFGERDQRLGFVAGDLTHGDRPHLQPLVEALPPSVGVALRGVLLQHEVIGDGLHRHQTDLGMKGFVRSRG